MPSLCNEVKIAKQKAHAKSIKNLHIVLTQN